MLAFPCLGIKNQLYKNRKLNVSKNNNPLSFSGCVRKSSKKQAQNQ